VEWGLDEKRGRTHLSWEQLERANRPTLWGGKGPKYDVLIQKGKTTHCIDRSAREMCKTQRQEGIGPCRLKKKAKGKGRRGINPNENWAVAQGSSAVSGLEEEGGRLHTVPLIN